jgi:hypothetical protein
VIHSASSRHKRDRFPALPPGAQGLADPPAVFRDDGVGGVEHHARRAVVFLQPHQVCPRKILLELAHVADVGAAPAVDRLVVVAHRADVAVAAQRADELVLGQVGVLELVDQQEREAALPGPQPVGPLPEQPERQQEEVVEVHRVGALQRAGHRALNIRRGLHHAIEWSPGGQRLRVDHPVLGRRDDRLDRPGREQLGRVAPLFHQAADEVEPVVLIVDRELAGEAEGLGLVPEQPGREGVEGADPEA